MSDKEAPSYEKNDTASVTAGNLDVSRETLEQPRERRPGRVRSEPGEREQDAARQAELDEAWAQARQVEIDEAWAEQRAADTVRLTEQEAANYAANHAIIERDEHGNVVEPNTDKTEE